jgi:predicted deacetylase
MEESYFSHALSARQDYKKAGSVLFMMPFDYLCLIPNIHNKPRLKTYKRK